MLIIILARKSKFSTQKTKKLIDTRQLNSLKKIQKKLLKSNENNQKCNVKTTAVFKNNEDKKKSKKY